MTDLSSPKIQANLKNNRRTMILTNAVMALLAALTAALAIWVAVEKTNLKLTDWSVGVFIALLSVIALLFVFIIVWELFLKRPYRRIIHRFVADCLSEHPRLFVGEQVAAYELCLVGDKLVLLRFGCDDYAECDLSPVKRYPVVCNYTVSLIKKYLTDYYSLNGKILGVEKVVLTDKVRHGSRASAKRLALRKDSVAAHSYFIACGMMGKVPVQEK